MELRIEHGSCYTNGSFVYVHIHYRSTVGSMEELAMMGNVGVVTTVCAVPSVTMQKGCLFPSYLTARLYDVVRVDSFLSLTKMVEG